MCVSVDGSLLVVVYAVVPCSVGAAAGATDVAAVASDSVDSSASMKKLVHWIGPVNPYY